MDALICLEAVTSLSNLKGLRWLYDDDVELHTRSLRSLGVEPTCTCTSYGGLLASVLMNKLPRELKLLVSQLIGEEEWKLDERMKLMVEEIQARERTTIMSSSV